MTNSVVYICSRLTKNGADDITLSVQRDLMGRPSPCLVTENGKSTMIGGDIESLEEMFQYQVNLHHGHGVKWREEFSVVTAGNV